MSKPFYVKLDLKKQHDLDVMNLYENDSNTFYIQLFSDGEPYDLSNVNLADITVKRPDDNYVVGTGKITDPLEGQLEYDVDLAALIIEGICQVSIELYSGAIKVSTTIFTFNAVSELNKDGQDVTGTSEYPVLVQLLSDASNAEALRTSNENTRVTNENNRITAESTRATEETTRVSNELSRITSETGRVTAEGNRVTAETARVGAESTRQTNETTRGTNESARVTAESTRQTNETTRGTNETARVTAESNRVTAEDGRATAEDGRVSAETTRSTNETARTGAETDRKNNETGRVTAEGNRVTAENNRVIAETAREAAEGTRETTFTTNEDLRQSTFVSNESIRQTTFNNAETTRQANEITRQNNESNRINEFDAKLTEVIEATNTANDVSYFGQNQPGKTSVTYDDEGLLQKITKTYTDYEESFEILSRQNGLVYQIKEITKTATNTIKTFIHTLYYTIIVKEDESQALLSKIETTTL